MRGFWKLTPADSEAIRQARAAGESVTDLAALYGVSEATIRNHLKPKARVQPPSSRVTTDVRDSRPYRDSTYGYVPRDCGQDRCGQPQQAGRPRRGWVQLKRAGDDVAPWFCSLHCLSRYAIHRELAGEDVA
jgi:predicted transcriptional regulator